MDKYGAKKEYMFEKDEGPDRETKELFDDSFINLNTQQPFSWLLCPRE